MDCDVADVAGPDYMWAVQWFCRRNQIKHVGDALIRLMKFYIIKQKFGPNEISKEKLSFCRHYLSSSLVFVDLMGSDNCEIKFQIVVIQY